MPETITLDEASGVTWTHVDPSDAKDLDWLTNQAGLGEDALSLLQLPRKLSQRDHIVDGVFVALAGIDPAEPSASAPPLSFAMLFRRDGALTVGPGTARAILDVRNQLKEGTASATPLELLAAFVVAYSKRLEPLITGLSEEADDLEEQVLTSADEFPIDALDTMRRKIFRIRRYLVAIRNVLGLIKVDPTVRTDSEETEALTAAADFVSRHLDSLADCQQRAVLLYDKIQSQISQGMAQATYNLTIVATIFLPLTFVTGLLGMNVSGIPESHDPNGFWIVVGGLVAIALVAWKILLGRKRLIRQ